MVKERKNRVGNNKNIHHKYYIESNYDNNLLHPKNTHTLTLTLSTYLRYWFRCKNDDFILNGKQFAAEAKPFPNGKALSRKFVHRANQFNSKQMFVCIIFHHDSTIFYIFWHKIFKIFLVEGHLNVKHYRKYCYTK